MSISHRLIMLPAVIAVLFSTPVAAQKTSPVKNISLYSPDKKISMKVYVENSALWYTVNFNGTPVIESSKLGVVVDGVTVGNQPVIIGEAAYAQNSTYPSRGVHSLAVNNFKGSKMRLRTSAGSFTLDARIFNNGIAFRYLIDHTGPAIVQKDSTSFVLPAGVTVWAQPNNKHYEGRYSIKKSEEIKKDEIAGPPVTFNLPGDKGYAAITEGGLTDFAGMSLTGDGNRGFTATLTGFTQKSGMIETPWRIVEIGKDLNALVNCDIIGNVSPPLDPKLFPKGYATDWVKPGRSVWSWLAANRSVTPENMKHFSDMAAKLGFEYNLVDEGWGKWQDGTRDNFALMKELVDYSATKGVKIWAWKAYPDRAGIPGIKDPVKRREFFQKCKDLGIVGLKIDFFDTEAQEIIDFYQAALKDAAEFHLMMDFHGANKPTGEERTWPNEMSREGIKGLESRPPWAPSNTILPFTRYLAGHADFTPVNFGDRLGEVTWAHHIATMVIFTSPFLCLGADPQSILDNPCKEMIKSIPPVWDETIVLPQSRIGDLVIYARRNGDSWFIGALNGKNESRTVTVPLTFLKKAFYSLSSVTDDPAKQANAILGTKEVTALSSITLPLNANGGYVARITKK